MYVLGLFLKSTELVKVIFYSKVTSYNIFDEVVTRTQLEQNHKKFAAVLSYNLIIN